MGSVESKDIDGLFTNELPDLLANPEREKFEQYLTILVMLEQFGTHGYTGSMKYKPLDYNVITSREKMAKQIQTFKLSQPLVEWVQSNMPEKLITHMEIPELMFQEQKDFANDPESYNAYISEVIGYLKENLSNLSDTTKIKIATRIQASKSWAKRKIVLENKKLGIKIQVPKPLKEPENVSDAESILLEAFDTGYFNSETFTDIKLYIGNSKENPELEAIKKSHLIKYYREKWSVANPDKVKIHYYLNWSDHWDLYCACPTEYINMIESYCLVDDYTFSDYKFDYYGFLDCLRPTVRANIINKIKSDNKLKTTNRYGPIVSLEDLVDISIFIQDPPEFLKHHGLKYYSEYNKLMYQYLANIKWDMNKFNYKTWNIIPTFQVEKIPNNVFSLLNE